MRSYHWKLALFVLIMISIGNFIPSDWKVLFGFFSGMTCGAYFIPYVVKERLNSEISKMWQKEE